MITNIKAFFGRSTRWDYIHLAFALALLAAAAASLVAGAHWIARPLAVVLNVYVLTLILLAALRVSPYLFDRVTAVFVVPSLFFALVICFAMIYLDCRCFVWQQIDLDSNSGAAIVTALPLTSRMEALYVSLGVITTAATDYVPANSTPHITMALETISGLLLLLMAFPILAGRLALFEASVSPTSAPNGKFRIRKTAEGWTVIVIKEDEIKSTEKVEELQVVFRDGKIDSMGKPD